MEIGKLTELIAKFRMVFAGLCQLAEIQFKMSQIEPPPLSTGARHLLPCIKRACTKRPIMTSFQKMTADAKQIVNLALNGKKLLRLSRRFESSHLAFLLSSMPMGRFHTIISIAVLVVDH